MHLNKINLSTILKKIAISAYMQLYLNYINHAWSRIHFKEKIVPLIKYISLTWPESPDYFYPPQIKMGKVVW